MSDLDNGQALTGVGTAASSTMHLALDAVRRADVGAPRRKVYDGVPVLRAAAAAA